MKIRLVLLFMFIWFYNNISFGEQILSLNDAISIAIKSNHYIKAKEYSLLAVKEDKQLAQSQFYPKVFFEERFTKGNYNSYSVFTKLNQERLSMDKFFNPGEVNNFQTALGLEMPIFVRELFINRNIKNKVYLAYENEFKRLQEDIAFEVFRSYLKVMETKAMHTLSQKALEDAKEIYNISQKRVKNGIGIKSDELRAYVFMKEKEAETIKAKNDLLISKRTLGLMLSKEESFDVVDLNEEDLFTLPTFDETIKNVVLNRKDFIADSHNTETTKESIEIYKSKFYPKVFLSGNYFNDDKSAPFGRDGSGYVVGVYLRWDIFDKTRYDEVKKAKFEYEKAREYLNQREKEIRFKVYESYLRVQEAREKLEVANNAVKEAEETFRLIRIRYDNNLSTMVEVLDAEVALFTAKARLVNAKTAYFEAIGKALYESGIFLKTVLNE